MATTTEPLTTHGFDLLREPGTGAPLTLASLGAEETGGVREGELVSESGARYPIRHFIPRFVEGSAYTVSFGEQWRRYRRTQIDRFNGTTISRERLFSGTGWTPEALRGRRVLEVGCGAGRFTQVLLDAGAEVYAVDDSTAVEACWDNLGPHPRLRVLQANLYALPFPPEAFDHVLCYGVLQHTPDPLRAFHALLPFLAPRGRLAVDVYLRTPWNTRVTSKYWYRPLTKRLPPRWLAAWVEWYVPRWRPLDTRIARMRGLWRLTTLVPCWNYSGVLPLAPEQLNEWAILDTFDALSAWYDVPQTLTSVQTWFEEAGLDEISVRLGGNGILGNGRRA